MPPNCLGIYSLEMHPLLFPGEIKPRALEQMTQDNKKTWGHLVKIFIPQTFTEHLESDSVLAGLEGETDTGHQV